MDYYFKKEVSLSFEDALTKVEEELKKEGFGILAEIDVKATLKKKLDVDFRKYKILGACNPPLAYKALNADDQIGNLLPCNVVVQENEEGSTIISAINPQAMMSVSDKPGLEEIAGEVNTKLQSVFSNI